MLYAPCPTLLHEKMGEKKTEESVQLRYYLVQMALNASSFKLHLVGIPWYALNIIINDPFAFMSTFRFWK